MKLAVNHLATAALTLAVVLPATAWADKDYSTVNKSITVDSSKAVGEVESVNGAIRVEPGAAVRSIESVNGAIRISEDVVVERNVEAVNGAIELSEGSEVGGNVETVNGRIKLHQTIVAGDVHTINGAIRLLSGTVVEGDVRVQKPNGWSSGKRKPVKVEIGENVQVHGDLIFEHPVELRLHDSARVGEVIGEEVTVIEG